jgi:hypothetical protein
LGSWAHVFSARIGKAPPNRDLRKEYHFRFILDEGMYSIRSTLIAVIAMIIVLFVRSQAAQMGVGGIFNIITILMIVLIIFGLIRTWFRG